MFNLTDPAHIIRVITTDIGTADLHVFASYVDKDGATCTPGNNSGVLITTNTTTTIVAAPAVGERDVLQISLVLTDYAGGDVVPPKVEVQFYNGATAFQLVKDTITKWLNFDKQSRWTSETGIPRIVKHYFSNVLNALYTIPLGVDQIDVECIGKGGNGGNCTTAATNAAAAGGGGAGGYAKRAITVDSVGNATNLPFPGRPWLICTYDDVFSDTFVGYAAAGIAFSFIGVSSGDAGSNDSVTTIHAGGAGGAGGAYAVTPTPNVGYFGEPGQFGVTLAAAQAMSGAGGSSLYGVGGNAIKNSTSRGAAATGYGAGGGGSSIISGGPSQVGGTGSPGLVIITEYRR